MLTSAAIASFASLAGDDFAWADSRGGHRPTAKVRAPLLADMLARQGGLCPVCGKPADRPEFNHVVMQGRTIIINGESVRVRRGYFPGNVFAGCHVCNAKTAPEFDGDTLIRGLAILPVEHFARPDIIPMEWTPFNILKAL